MSEEKKREEERAGHGIDGGQHAVDAAPDFNDKVALVFTKYGYASVDLTQFDGLADKIDQE